MLSRHRVLGARDIEKDVTTESITLVTEKTLPLCEEICTEQTKSSLSVVLIQFNHTGKGRPGLHNMLKKPLRISGMGYHSRDSCTSFEEYWVAVSAVHTTGIVPTAARSELFRSESPHCSKLI